MVIARIFRPAVIIAAALLSLAMVAPARAAHTPPGIVYVDDNCAPPSDGTFGDPFCTIQLGVNHASAGDTVRVALGNYPEDVTVNKSLTVLGGRASEDAITRSGPESVVRSFNLTANNVTVQGFTVASNTAGAGVTTAANRSGHKVIRNIIRDNVYGVDFRSNGNNHSTVSRNLIKDNNAPGFPTGNGVYTAQLRNAAIERNRFSGNNNYSINIETPFGAPQNRNLEIDRNEARNEKNFIFLFNTRNSDIERNNGRNFVAGGYGIQLWGDNNNLLLDRNDIVGAGIDGIELFDFGQGPNTNITLERNITNQSGQHGINLRNSTATAGGFTMDRNLSNNNGTAGPGDGIFIAAGNGGGLVERNAMHGNSEHDAHDNSVGTGTAGTANTWDNNNCVTDMPNGLCE